MRFLLIIGSEQGYQQRTDNKDLNKGHATFS